MKWYYICKTCITKTSPDDGICESDIWTVRKCAICRKYKRKPYEVYVGVFGESTHEDI